MKFISVIDDRIKALEIHSNEMQIHSNKMAMELKAVVNYVNMKCK